MPQPDYPLHKLYERHCEIAGWGMTEYNNTSSYPDSVRAARITVGDIPKNYCDYLYQRDVKERELAAHASRVLRDSRDHPWQP